VALIECNVDVALKTEPFGGFLLANRLGRGRHTVAAGRTEQRLLSGESYVLDPDTKFRQEWEGAYQLQVLRIDRAAVEGIASELAGGGRRGSLRFPVAAKPLSPERASAWNRVTRFLINDVIGAGIGEASPLVRRQSLRLVITTLLETFPSELHTADHDVGRKTAQPRALRRAMSFIEEFCGEAIDLAQIAAAARLSPRALQEAFRRHLDTTPTAYLREVRLQRAHSDLRMADPEEGTTVTDVAFRWGFANLSRFAAKYRERYGRAPSETLRS
jgi:AraC-like DNA-binding protein